MFSGDMTSDKIIGRIRRKGTGWVFTPSDFLDLGSPQAVGMNLLRLCRRGVIRKIDRGLYDLPKTHSKLGKLHPEPGEIVNAIARRDGTRLQEHEAVTANRLRLTEQVPARLIYLTPGRSRRIKAGPVTLDLRHRSARKLIAPAPMSAMVFSALRNIGKQNITWERIAPLRSLLSPKDLRQLARDLPKAPAWMHPHLRTLTAMEVNR
jgi:hypothetical protein